MIITQEEKVFIPVSTTTNLTKVTCVKHKTNTDRSKEVLMETVKYINMSFVKDIEHETIGLRLIEKSRGSYRAAEIYKTVEVFTITFIDGKWIRALPFDLEIK